MGLMAILGAIPTVIGVIGQVVGLIHGQEKTNTTPNSGSQKKATVVAQVNQTMPLISAIGTVANPGFDWSVFMGHVSALIDAVVGISNQLGAFQTTSKGATTVASK